MANEKETFPKIAGEAKLKQIIVKPDCVDLRFDDLSLSPNQIGDLARWQHNGDKLRMTIEQIQGELPLGG